MKPARVIRHRVLIGASSYADARAGLHLADAMADMLAESIGGLMLEEDYVAELIARPGQRVVSRRGQLIPAPSREELAALHDRDERAFRAALAAMCKARALHYSFERRQGELVAGLLKVAENWDMLVIGHGNGHLPPSTKGRVVLIAPPGGASSEAEALAGRLAQGLRAHLVTGYPANGSAAPQAPDFRWQNLPELIHRIARLSADAVVLDLSAGPITSGETLRALVDAARCPVLVLGAATVSDESG